MNHIRHSAALLAGLTSALLAFITTASAAFASTSPTPVNLPRPPGWNKHPPLTSPAPANLPHPPGWNKHPPLPDPGRLHAALASSMPGWQIALIAIAVAALATAAVLLHQARAARRRVTTSAA